MKKLARIEPPDVCLLGVTLVLVAIGVLTVFDSSYMRAADYKSYNFDALYFAKRQLIFAGIGLFCMFIASIVPMDFMRKMSIPLLFFAAALLVAVLVPGVGREVNGSRSWFKLGPLSFQPSEFLKLALVVYLARVLGRPRMFARKAPPRWVGALWTAGALIFLVIAQRDLGSAVVLSSVVFIMFAVAGARKRYLVLLGTAGVVMVCGLMCFVPHCKPRVDAFKDPWAARYDKGYQIVHSLIGFGTGGVTGVGIGEGRVKAYIPAASTDYIYSTVAEETGLIGSLTLLGLFALFTYRGLDVARRCASPFAALVAVGITSFVAIQALINMAVATNSIPATGLPMPFVSYGGSSLVILLTGTGILLSVSRHVHMQLDGEIDEDRTDRGRHRRTYLPRYKRRSGSSGGGTRDRAAVRR